MRNVILLLTLLMSTLARGDEEVHDAGVDHGAAAAIAGAVVLAIVYPASAIAGDAGDSLCSLGHNDPSCNTHAHASLAIPLIGGFLYQGEDKTLPVLSSVIQIAATGFIVGGLVVHKWRVRS